ncbi:MAG: PEP-CTERM sorting domain-containing protein, partial [Pirellulales bacterium]|nr:PEP-CTERM sorting domain-containing protein [Pirellulales bacterium]
DFDDFDDFGTAISPTQSGFLSQNGADTVHSFAGATVTISHFDTTPAPLFDRGANAAVSSGSSVIGDGVSISDLVRDFAFPSGGGLPRGTDIIISGPAATYNFEGWFHDSDIANASQYNQSLWVSTTGLGGTFTQIGPDIQPFYVEHRLLSVTANGTDDVVIRITNGSQEQTRINGFALSLLAPEPSTLALSALGIAGLLVRRRHRR